MNTVRPSPDFSTTLRKNSKLPKRTGTFRIIPAATRRVYTDANGAIGLHYWDQSTWTDGWLPNDKPRVGYDDPQQFGWEIVGSFNGWPGTAFDPNYALTSMGNGQYSGQFSFDAGIYDFKFRGLVPQTPVPPANGVWDTAIGNDFGNTGGNNTFAVTNSGDVWQFDLDLQKGRFRYFSVDQHGDFNGDGNTDAADYVYWRKNMPGNSAKYAEWRANFGRTANLTWLAHGSFGSDVALTDQGGGVFTTTLSGLTAGQGYDIQVLRSDASSHWPGSQAKITADASGNINLKFYELQGASWGDGWSPDTWNRVGYDDPHQFGWEIVGSFNGWPGANDPAFQLTDQGNGDYKGTFTFDTAGTYDWKFRQLDPTNPWNTSIGDDFGNAAGNNSFTVANAGDMWTFELDLPNGRWRAFQAMGLGTSAVPEPASALLLMMSLAFGASMIRRR